MKVDMIMPQMGESITEAKISKWLKNVGDAVQKDEIILEISTDKVDSEIPAPAAGILSEVLFKTGDVVPVKTKIAVIDTEGAATAKSSRPADTGEPSSSATSSGASSSGSSASSSGTQSSGTPGGATTGPSATPHPALSVVPRTPATDQNAGRGQSASDRFYSPLVKGLAEKQGIPLNELASIVGTGQGGRVTKEDFVKYAASRAGAGNAGGASQAPTGAPASSSASSSSSAISFSPTSTGSSASSASGSTPRPPARKEEAPAIDWSAEGTSVVPMDNMRQAIAEHMVRSKHTSPHVYSVQEVDMTRVSQWRKANKGKFEQSEGFSLSFTPFFLEAAVRGLLKFPYVNASVDGKKIILKKHVNLGCAVALGNTGLIVPVIKRAEERNLVGLARALNDLALRARSKKLSPDDISGGTFTVTNPGVFGTIIGTPIINQPQAAILCLGAIKKRPVVIDDMIAIREICYLTLSYDHRIIDGSLGGQFLAFLREYLETWDLNRPLV